MRSLPGNPCESHANYIPLLSSEGIAHDMVPNLVLKHINSMPIINSKFKKLQKKKGQITEYVNDKIYRQKSGAYIRLCRKLS